MFAYSPVAEDRLETFNTNYIGFASFAALIWDHVDTFVDEVEFLWKGRKGPFVYLFFFNRYFTPLGFIINLYAYLSPSWTLEVCARFVKYEGCTVSLAVEVVGIMMLLRIRALYANQIWITLLLATILVIETGVNIWLISHAGPVIHNPQSGVRACSMVFDSTKPYSGFLASSSAWIPLFYDTIIFGLTLYKTIPPLRRAEASYIIQRLFEDGLLYYSVIFSVTLVLTIMIIGAPQGTKNLAAQLEQLITVAMMSRITLNLRKVGNVHHTRTFNSTSSRPKRGFWPLRIHQLWDRETFSQQSNFLDSTVMSSTFGGETHPRSERRPSFNNPGRYGNDPLGIEFAVPESVAPTPLLTPIPEESATANPRRRDQTDAC